jgi:carbonic anhydrase
VSGSSQSPIDLGVAVEGDAGELTIRYNRAVSHGRDTGSTLEFTVAGGSAIQYRGRRYNLETFHFHTPSEHTIDGEFAAAEIHFKHSDADGNALVLSVLVDEGEAPRGARRSGEAVDVASLIPDSVAHFAYVGSFTTPPYTEGVEWVVLTERISLHPQWLQAFSERFGANIRPVQPINDRIIIIG